ncbi:MAG: Asp23/Gls24 family envelope stress response protein [Erysipelotrichales bacterium]|nr:Asp23/Gls24 family envelope stress response protein [Erysipelotrichales bacterium]MBQ2477996.1 Asp23/Gls24 family envelope stress response protein [Erysipelotrichales bacterium]MBQ4374274.1 Asp23/Gls24 family envelope stress response protein [Erysipelotrichales bacterium]MBQ5541921.1 Asp23/Gls24 family envelope stress response protein [Erysipelotrichales bacterium]
MAKEYIQINKDESDGIVAISTPVLESIATLALEEDKGIHLAGKENKVYCRIQNNTLSVYAKVKLDYGRNVASTCESAQRRVRDAIYQMTDIPCDDVSIDVVGFVFR